MGLFDLFSNDDQNIIAEQPIQPDYNQGLMGIIAPRPRTQKSKGTRAKEFLGDALQGIGASLGSGSFTQGFQYSNQLAQQRREQDRQDLQDERQNRLADFQVAKYQDEIQKVQTRQRGIENFFKNNPNLNDQERAMVAVDPEGFYDNYQKNQTTGPRSSIGKLTDDYKKGLIGKAEYEAGLRNATSSKSTNITLNTASNDKFYEELGKRSAEETIDQVKAGDQANALLGSLDQLEFLGNNIGDTGALTPQLNQAKSYLAQAGLLNAEDAAKLNHAEAFTAIINRMAPQLRVPGSGQQSDRELQNFINSIPSLSNTPGGNRLIIEGMRAAANRAVEIANLGRAVRNGQITLKERDEAIQKLSPLKLPSISSNGTQGQSVKTLPPGFVPLGSN